MSKGEAATASLLEEEEILALLSSEGPFATSWQGFEARPQQIDMLRDLVCSYNEKKIALIEAGTGTGKSLAYLIPALLWAKSMDQRTVISTNTINLQEQLLQKDIPMICKVLGIKIKAVLAKGMGNYVCLRRMKEALQMQYGYTEREREELHQIDSWVPNTKDGSKSSLPMMPSGETWERIRAEGDACPGKSCDYHSQCFFFRARQEAENADIIVANHHLLFADLSMRHLSQSYEESAVIPGYRRIVLDEAHNIEDVATEHFASRVNFVEIVRQLVRLYSERGGKGAQGCIPLLEDRLRKACRDPREEPFKSFLQELRIDLIQEIQEVYQNLKQVFNHISLFVDQFTPANLTEEGLAPETYEKKLRIRNVHLQHERWIEDVIPGIKQLIIRLKRLLAQLSGMEKKIEYFDDKRVEEYCRNPLIEIKAVASRVDQSIQVFEQCIKEQENPDEVFWLENIQRRGSSNTCISIAKLDISETLAEGLFKQMSSITLCSATLSTNRNFDFVKKRLGLTPNHIDEERIIQNIYDSPFNYRQQSLLVIPQNLPQPKDRNFQQMAIDTIWDAIQASHGNAFVLFTSYSMLRSCYNALLPRMKQRKMTAYRQGEQQRALLLQAFKKTDRSVLFGTDSFWEGVDVIGEALRCVILVKLPFQVPTEPLVQARAEAITAAGGNAFMEYSVPNAIVKFKQGFGRLIRHKKDRGCIVCLDTRLVLKPYGKLFLNSLPPIDIEVVTKESMHQSMQKFYRRTYPLVTG